MSATLFINKTGCQRRLLPKEFGPCKTVYYYFCKWKLEGFFEDIMDSLHSLDRRFVGRNESPSIGIIDSRSVKTSHYAASFCKGASKVIENLDHKYPCLSKLLVDGGYRGTL